MAGYIFHQNYSGRGIELESENVKYFPQFLQNLRIDSIKDFVNVQSKFFRIKQLQICDAELTNEDMQSIKRTPGRVNMLHLLSCKIDSNTIKSFMDACPNITHLCINYEVLETKEYDWLQHKYPALEHLEL